VRLFEVPFERVDELLLDVKYASANLAGHFLHGCRLVRGLNCGCFPAQDRQINPATLTFIIVERSFNGFDGSGARQTSAVER